MSTTYYIRTIDCNFDTNQSSGYSDNKAVYYDKASDHFVWGTDCFNNIPDNEYFYLCAQYLINSIPAKTVYGDYNYYTYYSNGVTTYNTDRFKVSALDPTNSRSCISTMWDTRGWTTSNLATFKTELCTQFENVKNSKSCNEYYNDATVKWGSDDNKVNLFLLHIKFRNVPTNDYYFPMFFKGNDGTETITI